MTLRVSGKNMDVGESLTGRAQSRISDAVSKYFDGSFDGHLTFEHEGRGFQSEIVIHLDTGVILRAHAIAGDATSAFEQMADHIEKRLRRYKRKLKSHRRKASDQDPSAQSYILQADESDAEQEENYSPPIINESVSSLPTMSVGEAVMELDLTQSDVQIFLNAGHGGMNVVYRRADGNIGWVDPNLAQS